MGRAQADRIAALSPETDFGRIVYLLTAYEFSWDIERALEFALFRTYAVPSISGLLAKTGEFERRPLKRYDDTELLLAEITENGLDSPQGEEAIARINQMHGRYRIANDDMLYVLSTFVFEPIRWLDRFGRRAMTSREKKAWFNYYRELGARLGIEGIPEDLAVFDSFNRRFESERFRPAESNRRIGEVTLNLLLGFYLPERLFPVGRLVALSLMDAPLREAMGFETPPAMVRHAVSGLMRVRSWALRVMPPRLRPRLITARRRETYPGGYRIAQLGVFPEQGTGAASTPENGKKVG